MIQLQTPNSPNWSATSWSLRTCANLTALLTLPVLVMPELREVTKIKLGPHLAASLRSIFQNPGPESTQLYDYPLVTKLKNHSKSQHKVSLFQKNRSPRRTVLA